MSHRGTSVSQSVFNCILSSIGTVFRFRRSTAPSMWGAAHQPLTPSHCRCATAVRLLSTGFRCCRLGQVPYTPRRDINIHPRATPFSHCVVWMFRSVVAVQLCVCARVSPPLLRRCCCCATAAAAPRSRVTTTRPPLKSVPAR